MTATQKPPTDKGVVWHREMPPKRTKRFVETYPAPYGNAMLPSIDVKIPYAYSGYDGTLMTAIRRAFPYASEHKAGQAAERAMEFTCEDFWDCWQESGQMNEVDEDPRSRVANRFFGGTPVTIHQCGRQGGHLVVAGLPPVGEWDAVMVARWWRFVDAVLQDIDCRLDDVDSLIDFIDANGYCDERAMAELVPVL